MSPLDSISGGGGEHFSQKVLEHGSFVCYNENSLIGYWIAYFTLSLGQCVWWGMKGLGYYDRQLIFVLVNLSQIVQYFIVFILQNVFNEERICGSRKNSGEVLLGTPCSEIYFFFSFVAFVICFNYSRNMSMQKSYLSGLIVLCALSIWAPWWTSNYTFFQVCIGAVSGTIVGSFIALSIHYFWLEDFPVILEMRFIKYFGYYDTLCIGTQPPDNESKGDLHRLFFIEPRKTPYTYAQENYY